MPIGFAGTIPFRGRWALWIEHTAPEIRSEIRFYRGLGDHRRSVLILKIVI
ncbi:hypothetical protein GGD64_003565 [Bradyrhizobium sp. CIR3A]|nr:hypothetical protein [Bradyrhizobium sp. CIR3A]